MAASPKIVAFSGSTRKDSYNDRLLRFAVVEAKAAGGDVHHVSLRDYAMPLYDGDLEARDGIPAPARAFKKLLISSAGFLIASPEYNSSISGVLKNAIDWASRPEPNEPSLVAFTGKTAALLSASPGALGGLRALVHVRAILGNIGVLVIPDQVAVGKAHEALDDAGAPKDEKQRAAVGKLASRLVDVTKRLA